MFDRTNYGHMPSMMEFSTYINNSLWDDFCQHMLKTYQTKSSFEFSKCAWEYGWNAKFKKKNKSLCTIYPRDNYFLIMLVIEKRKRRLRENFPLIK